MGKNLISFNIRKVCCIPGEELAHRSLHCVAGEWLSPECHEARYHCLSMRASVPPGLFFRQQGTTDFTPIKKTHY